MINLYLKDMDIKDEFKAHLFEYIQKMLANSKMLEDTVITPENIFQPAHKENRDLLLEIVLKAHLPGSTLLGVENILKLNKLAEQGKSCIIFSEHLSNMDVPGMFARFYSYPDERIKEIFEKIIFIAGVKLNENPVVKLFTEMFTRVVIFPIRSLEKMKDDEESRKTVDLARKINIKSTRKIKELRTKGHIFVMFPAGTRYRPWLPETKKGIKESASYLKSFDYFCCASINGNNMPPMEHEDMSNEPFVKDIMVYNYGEVRSSKEYYDKICEEHNFDRLKDGEMIKQVICDKIMENIDDLHIESDKYIENFKKQNN